MTSVASWNFSECKWVTRAKDDPDSQVTASGRHVQQFATQFANMKSIADKLATKGDWLAPALKERVSAYASHFLDRGELDEAISILAHSIICNVILTSEHFDDEKQWPSICQSSLMFVHI